MNYHVRKGKFGKQEQHMERRLRDFLDDIWKTAEGLKIDIRKFTMKNSRIVDTEMIKATAARMVELDTEIEGKGLKGFYTSYLYCALAVVSIDFTYFEDDAKRPFGSAFSWDNPYGPGRTMQAVSDRGVFIYLSYLNYLLTGKWLGFDIDDAIELDESPEEYQERMEDTFEDIEDAMEAELEERTWLPVDENISPEEAREYNVSEAARIKALYPGWKDLADNAAKLHKSFEKYYVEGEFERTVEKMAEEFLLAEGLCIYADENKFLDVMVLLNRAGKLLSSYMKETGR
ncbi:MAG: hypothetical protein K6F73_08495 [Lachnospiraceae bacterium]|nr:hypothetical protein [Lachnospiraceae bacterium]